MIEKKRKTNVVAKLVLIFKSSFLSVTFEHFSNLQTTDLKLAPLVCVFILPLFHPPHITIFNGFLLSLDLLFFYFKHKFMEPVKFFNILYQGGHIHVQVKRTKLINFRWKWKKYIS